MKDVNNLATTHALIQKEIQEVINKFIIYQCQIFTTPHLISLNGNKMNGKAKKKQKAYDCVVTADASVYISLLS